MPEEKKRFRISHTELRIAVITGLVVVLVAQWVSTLLWMSHEKQEIRRNGEQQLTQINTSVQIQTSRLFDAVASHLRTLDFWLAQHPHINPRTDRAFIQLAEQLRQSSRIIIDLRMASLDGKAYYIQDGAPKPVAEIADREYFRAQFEQATRGLFIGTPIRSRYNGRLLIPVSYPLRTAVAGIAMLYAAIEVEELAPAHENIRFKPDGTVALIRHDGTILARTPFREEYIGRSLALTPAYIDHLRHGDSRVYETNSSGTDSIPRLVSQMPVPGYPVMVTVSAGIEDGYVAWNRTRNSVLLIGILLSLAFIGMAAGLFWVFHVLEQARARLRTLATRDGLTGCLNRHAFDVAVVREFERSRRHHHPMVVLCLDLDFFKRINDSYGHAAGDAVLKACSELWKNMVRTTDLVGRTGGEEFTLVLIETDLDGGANIAERIRERTASMPIEIGEGRSLPVTLSAGLAALQDGDQNFEELWERADAALYRAKQGGRNRVEIG